MCYFHPETLGKFDPIWLSSHIFPDGFCENNHQLVNQEFLWKKNFPQNRTIPSPSLKGSHPPSSSTVSSSTRSSSAASVPGPNISVGIGAPVPWFRNPLGVVVAQTRWVWRNFSPSRRNESRQVNLQKWAFVFFWKKWCILSFLGERILRKGRFFIFSTPEVQHLRPLKNGCLEDYLPCFWDAIFSGIC